MEINCVNIGLCEMSARLFELSVDKGYDSKDFIEKLLRSDLAKHLYRKNTTDMWLSEAYIMESLEAEVVIAKGKAYNKEFMSWVGYLYRVWCTDYENDTPLDILEQSPFEVLVSSYTGFHVMSCEDAILNLKEIYQERH